MFDISLPALLAQLLVGLINGCFYAILSMGLAIIFGLLNIVNFTHGAQFMMAAFLAWIGFTQLPQLLARAPRSISGRRWCWRRCSSARSAW